MTFPNPVYVIYADEEFNYPRPVPVQSAPVCVNDVTDSWMAGLLSVSLTDPSTTETGP